MIVFFGPAGAGKSVQGQMLAARMGWRWLSAGQLLRDTHDPELTQIMQTGVNVSHDAIIKIMSGAIKSAANISQIILDGFPRMLEQAHWLVESQRQPIRAANICPWTLFPAPAGPKNTIISL